MLFRVIVVRNLANPNGGWRVSIAVGNGVPFAETTMGETAEHFPLPDGGEAALPPGITAAEIGDRFTNLMNQAGGSGAVEIFGAYLFTCLLAGAWPAILAQASGNPFELALTWAAAETDLNRLPWEAMHTSTHPGDFRGFLAGQPVTITRRVSGSTASLSGGKLPSPPRVLFVIGVPLSDPVIRPGAEYLGLLHSLEEDGLALNHRLLLDATLDSLKSAVESFKPNIVHIVSHGELSGNQSVIKFLKKASSNETVAINSENLLNALSRDGTIPLPTIVVLNACSTGASLSDELGVSRPMAAELIQRGVPIVVGMSGQVADQACRLFTKGFFKALLKPEDGAVGQAASRGRRAAIAHGGYLPGSVIDWALPTLYLSAALEEASLDLEAKDFEIESQRYAHDFLVGEDYPVFCGRWEILRQYRMLVSEKNANIQFLAVAVPRRDQTDQTVAPPRYGVTRLLKELAAQALRDGHVPILITKEPDPSTKKKEWPKYLPEFILQDLLPAALNTVNVLQKFSIHQDLSWSWDIFPRLTQLAQDSPIPGDFPAEFIQFAVAKWEDKRAMAFRYSLARLIDEVRSQRQARLGLTQQESERSLLILLVEDLHQMSPYIKDILALFGQYGLRKARSKIRVIYTYNTEAADGQSFAIDEIKAFKAYDVEYEELTPFHGSIKTSNSELDLPELEKAALVYHNHLLNWRSGQKKVPLTIASMGLKPGSPAFLVIALLADLVKGYPSNLKNNLELDATIRVYAFGLPQALLRPADDDDALAGLKNLVND